MGRVGVTIPYVRQTRSGFYWEPSRKVKALGFAAESLGRDEAKAFARARKLNEQVAAELRGDAPEPAAPIEGTLSWMIAEYRKSKKWRKLAAATQRGYSQCMDQIEKWAGDKMVEGISRRAVKVWQEAIEGRAPAFAAAIVRVFRVVMHFARDRGYKIDNFDKMDLHTAGGDAVAWEDYEISAYLDEARQQGFQSMALALMFGVCLGQREGDIIRLARNQYRDGEVSLQQHKTGARIAVPALPEMRAEIARSPVASPLFIISEATGRPYKADHFRHLHRRICRAAGISDDRWFMHLRHTAAQRLGDAGCSDDLIRSVTGHKGRAVVGRYVKPSSTMARAAIATLERSRSRPK